MPDSSEICIVMNLTEEQRENHEISWEIQQKRIPGHLLHLQLSPERGHPHSDEQKRKVVDAVVNVLVVLRFDVRPQLAEEPKLDKQRNKGNGYCNPGLP